ncbi:hypothetical protein V8J82_15330 [Gymnodinialimonas sp. 2305UL16-5]|uniref:hypothetical protein n=1 Tax=Gymnodinialimonas mytili TaxID=3126503 RepID=UPI0030A6BCC2
MTVQTPNSIVTGTSVIEFRATWCEDGCGFPPMKYIWEYTGEGVVVEVTPDRHLFVLPQTFLADAHRYAPGVLGHRRDLGERLHNASRLRDPVALPVEVYPAMLTFLDWGDRESLRSVNPTDLATAFGEGTQVISVTIEVTPDPVSTPRIANLLGWTCLESWPIRIPSDSPRGWDNISGSDFGRDMNLCY